MNPQYVEDFFDLLAASIRHSLVSHLQEQNYWVVESSGYEWRDWLLVNGENGMIDTTLSAPVTRPD